MTRVSNHGRFVLPLFCSIYSLSAVTAQANAREIESIPGQYVVQLTDSRSLASPRALETQLNGKIVDRVREDVVLIQRSVVETTRSSISRLSESPLVRIVEPNLVYRASKSPNDTNFKDLWGLTNTGALDSRSQKGLPGVDISAEKAWEITTGSKDVVVAVIDTGIDFKIADLSDNAWINHAEANGKPGVDDDGNGYVDDVNGYDFANDDGDATDDHSHGSHCAGTIGARGDDSNGVAGVNWNAKMMAVKFLDVNGSGSLANAIKSIDYARKNGAKIMSNSWGGGGFSSLLEKAIADTRDAGILFVAAAGNDGSDNDEYPTYPANYEVDNVLSVAAIDNRGELASFSNYGAKTVHVAAPGVNVISTTPGGLKSYSGTSMATPHVSGIAALVASESPSASYKDLKSRIVGTVRETRALKGKVAAGGIANAYSALSGVITYDEWDAYAWSTHEPYSISTPSPYPADMDQTYTVKVPGASFVAVRFSRFKTEPNFDRVTFTNAAGEFLGSWSGERSAGTYSPIADGDTLVIRFESDDNVQFDGFEVDTVSSK